MAGRIQIRETDVSEILPLRHRILRLGLPESASWYPQDQTAETFHLAASVDGELVGCITVFPESWEAEPGWRLRGMATAEAWRGKGVGTAMLREAQRRVVAGAVLGIQHTFGGPDARAQVAAGNQRRISQRCSGTAVRRIGHQAATLVPVAVARLIDRGLRGVASREQNVRLRAQRVAMDDQQLYSNKIG